jgi:transcription antitermination factor NusG
MPWYVLYTNPKAEKKVAEQLNRLGIEVYCPTVVQVKQWSDRKKKVESPLFTSYVFVNIEDAARDDVFKAKGVVRYLFWLGKPAVVKNEEIAEIKKWLAARDVDIEFEALHEGDEIEITEGQFKGQTGTVQQIDKNYIRLIIKSIGFVMIIKPKGQLNKTEHS